jgi:hypothetical protein
MCPDLEKGSLSRRVRGLFRFNQDIALTDFFNLQLPPPPFDMPEARRKMAITEEDESVTENRREQ